MKDPFDVAGSFGPEHVDGVVIRLSRVDHDRASKLARQRHLAAKRLDLGLPRREVVVIVEPDLPYGAGPRAPGDSLAHDPVDGIGRVGEARGLVRVDAHGESDLRPHLGHAIGALPFRLVGHIEDTERAIDGGRLRPCHDLFEVRREGVVREMAVRIDHRTWEPAGARSGSSGVRSTASPSAAVAASTMPFDSIPTSFAGFKFATKTTCRPMSVSGS